ncbi:MAG: hypothetical protein J6Q13_00900 [Clostridia bacterium]|nr:hypothetical protein [Clostridia bacterium]
MTEAEILYKSNSYKAQLNECSIQASKCESALNSFQTFRNYFNEKENKSKKFQNRFFVSSLICLPLSIVSMFFSLPLAIICLMISVVCCERFIFFKKITHKFKHCHDFFEDIVKNLSNKHFNFKTQKEEILAHLIELEHTIPEKIIESIALMNEEKINKDNQNSEKTEIYSL